MNRFQEMAEAGARAEPEPVATNPFRTLGKKLDDEAYERARVAFYASMDPEPVKNRRGAKPGRLRVSMHEKLGDAHWSHTVDGREVAEIENINATFRRLSNLDFEVDEDEPQELNYLTINQVQRAYKAMMLLHCMGLNFNIWYTCNWTSVKLTTDEQVAEAVEWQIVLLRKWLEYRGAEFHYIWVVERGEGRGLHMHVLLHLPKEVPLKKFERQVSQTIFTITGMYPRCPAAKPSKRPKRAKRSMSAKPIDPSVNPFADVPIEVDDTRTVKIERLTSVGEQWHLWRYIMKGIHPEEEMHIRGSRRRSRAWIPLARYLGLEENSHQGQYLGQRFGRSQTLGPEAWRWFKVMYGMPPNPFWTAEKPGELYGRQFLDFAKALGNPQPKPKKDSVKLLRFLEI
ncbi:hypothetical protein D3273_01110 [Lichenibacterium minor]|uniref:Replication-associated protein ORF2/G2P domain-containing protein n=1 Tax=Lichenibacterium minor TaxID=2316528 RepID=A0A4Q2UBA5_9HYPH|nr:hypothetical protein [Lichenibacterium minor]RYC33882.1 hypothetical protein D3273_01110 [Lichenibacterium minor]